MTISFFHTMGAQSKRYFLGVSIILLTLAGIYYFYQPEQTPSVTIGYFHGGHSSLLYRTYINDYFDRESIKVSFITRALNDETFHVVPTKYDEISDIKLYGKVTGEELIGKMMRGDFVGAVSGESSFINAVTKGLPIVAVARLGYDTKKHPGHAIIFRKGVKINTSEDLKGKIMASRRSGPGGDKVFLREFLRNEGLDPENDVIVVDDLPKDKLDKALREKDIDGAFYHIDSLIPMVTSGNAYVYRKMDWMNPELSQAFLVFRKDFVEKNPESVKRFLRAYLKRISYEQNLSLEERREDPGKYYRRGNFQIETDFMGMNFPQFDLPPTIDITLLNEMQELLYNYNYIKEKTDLSNFIDNSFVEEIYEEIQ